MGLHDGPGWPGSDQDGQSDDGPEGSNGIAYGTQQHRVENTAYSGTSNRDELVLPLSRVKRVAKQVIDERGAGVDAAVKAVNNEATHVITKAAELFLECIVGRTCERMPREVASPSLEYDDIAETVQAHNDMRFLRDVVPRMYSLDELLHMLREQDKRERQAAEDMELDEDREANGHAQFGCQALYHGRHA